MFGFGDQWETSALTPLWNNVNIVVDKILPGHTRGFFLGSWKDGWALALYQSTTTTTIKCKDSKYLRMVLICLYVCIVCFFFCFSEGSTWCQWIVCWWMSHPTMLCVWRALRWNFAKALWRHFWSIYRFSASSKSSIVDTQDNDHTQMVTTQNNHLTLVSFRFLVHVPLLAVES